MTSPFNMKKKNEKCSKKAFFDIFKLANIGTENTLLSFRYNKDQPNPKILSIKNNKIQTGYENLYLKKGNLKLYPFKDFDFVGINAVVCQKCFLKFNSRNSYQEHFSKNICKRICHGPNPIYFNYKLKSRKQVQTTNKKKALEEEDVQDVKEIVNVEMLNTLQTRNNCYSDVVQKRNKNKNKPGTSSNETNEPPVKKPRGRPRKNPKEKLTNCNGPNKMNNKTDSNSTSDTNVDNKVESNKVESNGSDIASVSNVDTVNNNVINSERLEMLSSKIQNLTSKFWKMINIEWKSDKDAYRCQSTTDYHDHSQCIPEENRLDDFSEKEKNDIHDIEVLEKEMMCLLEQPFQILSSYKDDFKAELKSMLSRLIEKHNELIRNKVNKTYKNNELTTGKGKENMRCVIKKNKDDKEVETNKHGLVKSWINGKNVTTSTVPSVILNDSCESITEYTDIGEQSTNADCFGDSLEIITDNINLKSNNSFNDDINIFCNSMLNCKICSIHFTSIAEWKMHYSEHTSLSNKKFLCKICGLKFKKLKNLIHHMYNNKNDHLKTGNKPNFHCKICNKKFNFLRSYFSHVKTHSQ